MRSCPEVSTLPADDTKQSAATLPTSPPYRKPWPMPSWPRRKLDEAPLTRKEMEAREVAAKTCNRYRDESNGQGSVIDAYNAKVSIAEKLEAAGYTRNGARWKRPGGKSASVTVQDGRSFHHSSNDPLSNGYWRCPFDVLCTLEHGGDCRAAVKAAAGLLGMDHRPSGAHLGKSSSGLSSSGESVVRNWTPLPTTSNI